MKKKKPKQILNNPKDSVDEFISGLLLQYPTKLQKLENHHVLLTTEQLSSSAVNLLSGGGCGHEPSHAGWIGKGMLAGAVCGGIFASPSVASILAAIRATAAAAAAHATATTVTTDGGGMNHRMAGFFDNFLPRGCQHQQCAADQEPGCYHNDAIF